MAKTIAKITPKTMGVDFDSMKKVPKTLFQIIGYATSVISGESTFGLWTKIRGAFEAVNVETGEIFVSGNCFLSPAITDLIAGQLASKNVSEVEFGFLVKSVPNLIDGREGYEYVYEPLFEIKPVAILEKIRAQIKTPVPVAVPKKK